MALRDWLGVATLATSATVGGATGRSVATVATVAGGSTPQNGPTVATVATVASPANDPAPVATPEQAAELRELVGIVAADWPDDERAEAIAFALADPADALTSFRALVAGRPRAASTAGEQAGTGRTLSPVTRWPNPGNQVTTPSPEMRACVECANLSPGGRCLAAFRGDLPGYPRGYSPALTDRAQRCAGYAPGRDDSDRRTGRERWPLMLKGGNQDAR